LLLEAFLAAVIGGLLSPEFTKIREEVVKKVKNRIRSQSSFGERALNRPISDFSEKDHEEIRNIVVTTIEEYDVSKEIKNTLAESYSTVLSTKSVHVIRIMNGINEGREYILEVSDVTKDIRIGRCPVCKIHMDENDDTVSRHHARLLFENDAYFIEDTWSTNGTKVNGREIKGKGKTRLCDKDRIEIGQAELLFRESERLITVRDGRGMEAIRLDKIKRRRDMRMGRCPVCEIRMDENDRTASRHHARVIFENNEYFIEDICSVGGTLVNSKKIDRKKLEDGDEIKIGKALMQFRSRGMEEKAYGAFGEV
jgi:pSer/pThr/pTyr-binding forkhead associated (FHA) protein